jgi:hypothetical protein
MSKAFKCDRCGELYAEQPKRFKWYETMTNEKFSTVEPITVSLRVNTTADLCIDCQRKLFEEFCDVNGFNVYQRCYGGQV